MRVRRSETELPRCFCAHPHGKEIIAECDIGVTPRASLMAKLVIFPHKSALHRFWRKVMGTDLGRGALGAVNNLASEVISFPGERRYAEVDPRYFCLIGLSQRHLSMEIITHEATHAALFYARRHSRKMWCGPDDLEDEAICYPVGRIAASINRFIYKKNLYLGLTRTGA